jgi:hypothetical protein
MNMDMDMNMDMNMSNKDDITPSIKHGNIFKKYRTQTSIEEFSNISNISNINLNKLYLKPTGLTKQSDSIISKHNYSSKQDTINTLRQNYDETKNEYEKLILEINHLNTNYLERTNPKNPYLGKNIQFSTGETAYVTYRGVVKLYPKTNMDIMNNTLGLNGCPKDKIIVNIPWTKDYNIPGVDIPTTPPLITGTPMQQGQTCGNEGQNVFVNSLIDNLESVFINCYNNIPSTSEIMFVPKMTSNNTNGFSASASSVFENNDNFTGPWKAFDRDINTWWHSSTDKTRLYDSNTGVYKGINEVTFVDSNKTSKKIRGETLTLSINQLSAIPLTKYTIQGRQGCCGVPNGRDPNTWYILGMNKGNKTWYFVDYQSNASFNFQMKTFFIPNPQPYDTYCMVITVAGNSNAPAGTRSCVQIATWELYTGSTTTQSKSAMKNIGNMNFNKCEKSALYSGNKYFSLQNPDENGIGSCMVSNDLASSQQYGISNMFYGIPIWSSNTENRTGNLASLTNTGSLIVSNTEGKIIFSTPSSKSTSPPSNYIGCYYDQPFRAMALQNGGSQTFNLQQCQESANKSNSKFFGLQNSKSGTNAQCALSNDLNQSTRYGKANNCTKLSDGSWSGGGWSNAIYGKTPDSNYFLILGDDGNMVINRGTSPSDNQGVIWKSSTSGKQQQPNPNYAASKGKYGQNWVSNGFTLAPNEFIGSNNGSIYLLMQTDGNLVLYTSNQKSGCTISKSSNGKYVGSQNVNALYQIKNIGNKNDLGNLAYVDDNSELYPYPTSNIEYDDTYKKIKGFDNVSNDIPNASYGNATVESCESTCNGYDTCGAFVFTDNNVCYPKDNLAYPNSDIHSITGSDLYVRNKKPINPTYGASSSIKNIDSIKYHNYINGGKMKKEYGLVNATAVQKQKLDQLQTKMKLLARQLNNLTNKFGKGAYASETQMQKNVEGFNSHINDINIINDINNINEKIKHFSDANLMSNILDDSNINVLQQNYEYLFWSILAAGSVLVSMNIMKK